MALRSQVKNKLFSVINIFGLAIGIAVSILIINYVCFEFSFDKMHAKRDRIYRVESRFYEGDHLTDDWATSSFGYGSAISNEMTGIEDYVRIGIQNSEQTVIYKEKRNRETGIVYCNPSFFTVFDFKLKDGLITDQLKRPNTVVITEEVARRFFGNETAIGKVLTFASRSRFVDCEITGVLQNFPKNSHISFNYFISYETLPNFLKEFWYQHETYTYLLLSPGKNPKEIEMQFPEMAEKYKTQEALKNKKWAVTLVPLTRIHFNPQKQYEREIKGNERSLVTLIIIAIVILLTAWINYINLTTARAMERAKDIGIRKVAGASRLQLIRQHLIESWLTNLLSIVLAAVFVVVLFPAFNHIIGEPIGLFLLKQPFFWLTTIAVLASGIFLSGFYPAFIMTRIKPSVILKGNYFNSGSAGTIRQVLVVFQFAAALFLICGTFIVYKQVRFMQRQNLDVDISQTIVLKFPVSRDDLNQKVVLFAKALRQESQVSSATVAGSVPGMEVGFSASNRLLEDESEQHRLYEMLAVDEYFIETFGFKLLAGRPFQKEFGNERENLLVNESAMALLGFHKPEEAIGKQVLLEGEREPVTIIGVVKNWHQQGLGKPYTPIMFLMNGRINWIPPRIIAVKTSGADTGYILDQVKELWKSYFPESGFDYFFLDHFFDLQYKSDKRFGKIVSIFTALAFFISLLGLWALAAFTASKRTKETGVRKVLGARTGNIIYLYSKEIIVLILIALVIAMPVSLFVMKNWLLNYAFHIEINFWVYIAGGAITIIIALFTVSWQSWKAATRNPVEALRYE
ncbi:MAG: ABC transporter permease [Prolixibacteraceae bacterium]|jgi:putative ABC transport system permease protein|nr:ABC transporter permease [Prolixibacteraceae bacterium]